MVATNFHATMEMPRKYPTWGNSRLCVWKKHAWRCHQGKQNTYKRNLGGEKVTNNNLHVRPVPPVTCKQDPSGGYCSIWRLHIWSPKNCMSMCAPFAPGNFFLYSTDSCTPSFVLALRWEFVHPLNQLPPKLHRFHPITINYLPVHKLTNINVERSTNMPLSM